MTRNLALARAAWGKALPDWVEALARECDATSQNRAGQRFGISGSTVSTVLANKYPAGLDRIASRVRGHLLDATVPCPVLGDLPSDLCQEWQTKAERFHDTGQLRRRMFKACRACPRYRHARKAVPA